MYIRNGQKYTLVAVKVFNNYYQIIRYHALNHLIAPIEKKWSILQILHPITINNHISHWNAASNAFVGHKSRVRCNYLACSFTRIYYRSTLAPQQITRAITSENSNFTYLEDSSMEKNTYSPESTIPSSSAASNISRMVVELAHITTTEIKGENTISRLCVGVGVRKAGSEYLRVEGRSTWRSI